MYFAIANTVIRKRDGVAPAPPVTPSFIWSLNTRTYNLETRVWSHQVSWATAGNNWESETEDWEII